MEARQFDDVTRLFAQSGTRRGLIRAAYGTLVAAFVGKTLLDWIEDSSAMTCEACEGIVGAVIGDGCQNIVAGSAVCKSLGAFPCYVASVTMCLMAKLVDLPGMDEGEICASSMVEKITRNLGSQGAPCEGPCGPGMEVCPADHRCVPRCSVDSSLDRESCQCVSEPVATRGEGKNSTPRRPSDQTGARRLRRWTFIVPEDQVMILGAESVTMNGVPYGNQWILAAYRGGTSVDMTIGHGFWTVVEAPTARAFFCGQLHAPTQAQTMSYQRAIGLDEWGSDICWEGARQVVPFATEGNQYASPFYGYQLSWSDAWTVTMDNSWWVGGPEGGFDQIQLAKGTSVVAVTGTREWGGDGQTCLDGVERGIATWPGDSAVFRIGAVDDRPLGIFGGSEEAAAYQYTYTGPSGIAEQRIAYVDCVTLPGDAANMVILFDAPIHQYAEQLGDREEIVASLRLSGGRA